jgi:hypothetical protein
VGDGVVQGAGRGVVLLGEPVDTGGAELIGECVDGVDEPACDVPATPLLGDVEVLQVAGRVRGPGGGMEDQVREPGQLIFLFGDESVHRRGRVAQRRPGVFRDLRGESGPVEVEVTAPQRFPTFPVVRSDRSDRYFANDLAPPAVGSIRPRGIVSVSDSVPLKTSLQMMLRARFAPKSSI